MENEMTVLVRIPTALRKLADGKETLNVEGGTVGQVITALQGSYPSLAEQLIDDKGQVRRFVNLFADDEDIRFLDDLDTTLRDGAELSIVPAIAGGR
jgi:molybdopterin synthase sulfur carrier subunit